jgi:hypothetical protein
MRSKAATSLRYSFPPFAIPNVSSISAPDLKRANGLFCWTASVANIIGTKRSWPKVNQTQGDRSTEGQNAHSGAHTRAVQPADASLATHREQTSATRTQGPESSRFCRTNEIPSVWCSLYFETTNSGCERWRIDRRSSVPSYKLHGRPARGRPHNRPLQNRSQIGDSFGDNSLFGGV